MKLIFGILLVVLGIALGIYVGVWLMFVGGIVQIVKSIQAGIPDATVIAWGIVKIIFAGVVGGVSGLLCIAPGAVMIKNS